MTVPVETPPVHERTYLKLKVKNIYIISRQKSRIESEGEFQLHDDKHLRLSYVSQFGLAVRY